MRKDKGLNGDLDRLPMLTWDSGDIILTSLAITRLPIDRLASQAANDPTTLPNPMFSPRKSRMTSKPPSNNSARSPENFVREVRELQVQTLRTRFA